MSPLIEMAMLNKVHEALLLLVEAKLIPDSERTRLIRKFMDDRPDFTKAVQESFNKAEARTLATTK